MALQPKIDLTNDRKFEIARKLFPEGTIQSWEEIEVTQDDIQLFTENELIGAVNKLKLRKAPSPDKITNEMIQVIVKEYPNHFLKVMNKLIRNGRFPEIWKRATLALIEKPKKNKQTETKYRPICLLDGMGKVMEYMIASRIIHELEAGHELSENQYGFRKSRSTVDAMMNLKKYRVY